MINIKKYRNEWKYLLSNQELSVLKTKLEKVLELDKHTPKDGRYIIHSLYFDNHKDESIYTTDAGMAVRFKWRIRYYGNDLSYIVLERKEKLEGRCHKKSCKLTIDEYNSIIAGEITDIVYNTEKKLIKELAADMMIYGYHPKVIVDYERVAFVGEITNVRITFDMKISASYDLDEFLNGDYQRFYILPSEMNVLEVKFDEIMPSYIKNILDLDNLNQTAFSKYYYGRKILDCYMH